MATDSGSACLCSLCCKFWRFSMVFWGMLPKDNTYLQTHAHTRRQISYPSFHSCRFIPPLPPSFPPSTHPSGHVLVAVQHLAINESINLSRSTQQLANCFTKSCYGPCNIAWEEMALVTRWGYLQFDSFSTIAVRQNSCSRRYFILQGNSHATICAWSIPPCFFSFILCSYFNLGPNPRSSISLHKTSMPNSNWGHSPEKDKRIFKQGPCFMTRAFAKATGASDAADTFREARRASNWKQRTKSKAVHWSRAACIAMESMQSRPESVWNWFSIDSIWFESCNLSLLLMTFCIILIFTGLLAQAFGLCEKAPWCWHRHRQVLWSPGMFWRQAAGLLQYLIHVQIQMHFLSQLWLVHLQQAAGYGETAIAAHWIAEGARARWYVRWRMLRRRESWSALNAASSASSWRSSRRPSSHQIHGMSPQRLLSRVETRRRSTTTGWRPGQPEILTVSAMARTAVAVPGLSWMAGAVHPSWVSTRKAR